MLTQDVETLAPGELRFGALLTPQGRLLYDLFLVGLEDGCVIDCAAEYREALLQRLTIYRLRAKVLATGGVQLSLTKVLSGTETIDDRTPGFPEESFAPPIPEPLTESSFEPTHP